MTSLADAGMVTVGVTDLAVARAAPLADAGMAFPANSAGIVTVGVTYLADAGMAFPADLAVDVHVITWRGIMRSGVIGMMST